MTNDELIRTLREYADWADGNEWEVPLMLADHLRQAAEKLEQLKAYEDTGLEPEEVLPKDKADEIALKLMRLADLESICSYTRLRELAEADKDGRLVVPPCKVGDTVWYRTYTNNGKTYLGIRPHKVIAHKECIVAEGYPVNTELQLDWLGKVWFFSQEEAERALEGMRNGNQ